MTTQVKRGVMAAIATTVIIASCCWTYFTQFRSATRDVGLHRYIGQVLAQQTSQLIGKKGSVVTIAIETGDWPELETQIQAFKTTLNKLGDYQLREYEMETKDQPKYGVGSGLSGRRYIRTVKKNENADVFVSFVGAPNLSPEEIAELGKKPRLIAESRSGDNLPELFDNKLISIAVVSRFQFPSPGPEKPSTPAEWFAKRYQVLTPEIAAALPKPD